MSAKKNSSTTTNLKADRKNPGRFSGVMKKVILCAVLVGLFIAGAYAAWHQVAARVLSSREYAFGPQELDITPLPAWIHTDLSGEIYRELSRDGPLTIMDDNLTERVAAAFSRHPWVAKVQKVSKEYPARVKVVLIYRKPVCMVELAGGLMPVDAEAVLLPTADFTPPEAAKYPRLAGVDRGPMGVVGARWGDSRVVGGAEIANALLPFWEKFDLHQIIPLSPREYAAVGAIAADKNSRLGEYYFVILSRKGMRILWGPAPGANVPGEPTPQQKVKKLEQFVAEHGSLDYPQGPRELDLQKP
jgi:hypothetical protein